MHQFFISNKDVGRSFVRFVAILAFDGQTDRQTTVLRLPIPRCRRQRGKNTALSSGGFISQ